MEVGVRPDGGGIEPATARGDGDLERVQAGGALVEDRLVDRRPEVFGGLQVRAVGRQEAEADRLGDGKPFGPCQPASSSTRTMLRSRPAPVCRAKLASSAAKTGFERPLARYQTASPLVGCTKATTCSQR